MRGLLCRSCSAPIFFAITDKGRRMPLDSEPNSAGNVSLGAYDSSGLRIATVLSNLDLEMARADGALLYMPHHAVCPESEAWKRRGNKTMPRQQ